MEKSQSILKLIAETNRAVSLIGARTGENALGYCLIKKPAVDHEVERWIRCADLYLLKHVAPMCPQFCKSAIYVLRFAPMVQKLRRVRPIIPLA